MAQTTQKERIEKICSLNKEQSLRLIFEWVKTKKINLKEFKELIELEIDS